MTKYDEEDRTYISEAEHWELIENRTVYIYEYKGRGISRRASVNLPWDIADHLGLKHGDKVHVAIMKKQQEPPQPCPMATGATRR